MMCDLLLVNSPLIKEKNDFGKDYLPPFGLLYIADYLIKSNKKVYVKDAVYEGTPIKEIIDYINDNKPDFLGINIFTTNYELVKEIVCAINDEIKIIIGGNVVKFIYEKISKWPINNKCYLVIGDGEKITLEIINDTITETPIYEKDNFSVYRINRESKYFENNINRYSVDRSLCEIVNVNFYGDYEESIITSRGCPFDCAFCGSAVSLNRDINIRRRSRDNIISELDRIFEDNDKVKSIRVLDDLFLNNRNGIQNAIEIFNSYPQISWRAMAHVKSFSKSFDLIDDLFDSGCKELFIGIESGSDKVRNLINKIGSRDDIIKLVELLLKSGINVKGYFILGFPDENIDDIKQTYKLAKELSRLSKDTNGNFRVSAFKFRPYHGTKLYNKIILSLSDKKINMTKDDSFSNNPLFDFTSGNFSDISDSDLEDYLIKISNID